MLEIGTWLHQAPLSTLFLTSLVAYLFDVVLFFFSSFGHFGVKPLFLFIYIVIPRRFVPQPFTFPAEVQFPFVSFDRVLIISSLDSLVFRLGILIYDSLSPFPLRLTRVLSKIPNGAVAFLCACEMALGVFLDNTIGDDDWLIRRPWRDGAKCSIHGLESSPTKNLPRSSAWFRRKQWYRWNRPMRMRPVCWEGPR